MTQLNIEDIDARRLVLIRGLPGSGKSTLAREIASLGYRHLEADMFFEGENGYVHEESKVDLAHEWCLEQARKALAAGQRVVISNMFHRKIHMHHYLELDANPLVLEMTGDFGSVHAVPDSKMAKYKAQWEAFEGSIKL